MTDRNPGRRGWPNRAEDLRLFVETGETLDGACARLGVGKDAIWKWCRVWGYLDLYEALAARQRRMHNQHTKGRVA